MFKSIKAFEKNFFSYFLIIIYCLISIFVTSSMKTILFRNVKQMIAGFRSTMVSLLCRESNEPGLRKCLLHLLALFVFDRLGAASFHGVSNQECRNRNRCLAYKYTTPLCGELESLLYDCSCCDAVRVKTSLSI